MGGSRISEKQMVLLWCHGDGPALENLFGGSSRGRHGSQPCPPPAGPLMLFLQACGFKVDAGTERERRHTPLGGDPHVHQHVTGTLKVHLSTGSNIHGLTWCGSLHLTEPRVFCLFVWVTVPTQRCCDSQKKWGWCEHLIDPRNTIL